MSPRTLPRVLTSLLLVLSPGGVRAFSGATPDPDRILAPYFEIRTPGVRAEDLPLRSTSARMEIGGVIMKVTIVQSYWNRGTVPIDATYVFPGSTRAAVTGMRMRVQDRIIRARIMEKQRAKATFEAARREGKSASLLSQHRPNVFQMDVANVMPGEDISVELTYTELLVPTDGVYEVVYPTVVGPRYGSGAAEAPADVPAAPGRSPGRNFLPEGSTPASTLRIFVDLAAGVPIEDASSPSHRINLTRKEPARFQVELDPSESHGGNRDFVLRYALQGNRIQTGLLVQDGPLGKYFLLIVQPPRNAAPDPAAALPREYVFIVDVSGSMSGFPLQTASELMAQMLAVLTPRDRLNVMLFSGGAEVLSPESLPATPENLARAQALLAEASGGGTTELLPALRSALKLPASGPAESRTFVVITDGYVTCEAEAFGLVRRNLDRANLFAIGIGSSVNRHLIEGLARAGAGEPFVVLGGDDAGPTVRRFRDLVTRPALTHLAVTASGLEVTDREPETLPDLLADRPVVLFGKYRQDRKGSLTLRGHTARGTFEISVPAASATVLDPEGPLPHLWARHRIATLCDDNHMTADAGRVAEVTRLGLEYSILTDYTSFVAVDEVVRNPGGTSQPVNQPLPLPQGVTSAAGDGLIPTTPEPEEWAMMLILSLILARHALRNRGQVRA